MNSTLKAWFVTALFAGAGLWALFYRAPSGAVLLPHLFFFAVLLVNTFFSVRLYAAIQPKDIAQSVVDTVLAVTYLALAFSLGEPAVFAWSALALFAVAPLKYMFILNRIPHNALLRRKIRIDLTGTAACGLFLLGTLAGHALASAWAFAALFALANVYLLAIRPMYRL